MAGENRDETAQIIYLISDAILQIIYPVFRNFEVGRPPDGVKPYDLTLTAVQPAPFSTNLILATIKPNGSHYKTLP